MRSLLPKVAVIAVAATALSLTAACGGTGSSDANSITLYSVDGLNDWYKTRFEKFKTETGISVNVVESGSGEVVARLEKEKANQQADLIITLPPFIQEAAQKDLLEPSGIDTSAIPADEKDAAGKYFPLINNYLCFIANPAANPAPVKWDDLLTEQFKGKLQYSTPGQSGDGTAVLLLLQHLLGKEGALAYLGSLQANNVGPSSSTGKLQPKVSNGELLVANGDVQMNLASIKNSGSKFNVFFPASADGKRTTIAIPYFTGLAKNAPHADKAKKLMEFLLSEESQKTVGPEALGVSVLDAVRKAGGPTDGVTPTALLDGVEVWQPDWEKVRADLKADVEAYQKATGS